MKYLKILMICFFAICASSTILAQSSEDVSIKTAESWKFTDISGIAWDIGMDEDALNIIAASADGNIYEIDREGKLKTPYKVSIDTNTKVYDLGVGKEGSNIYAIISAGTKSCMINTSSKKEIWCRPAKENENLWASSISANGKYAIIGTSLGEVEAHNTEGKVIWSYKITGNTKIVWKGVSVSNDGTVAVASYSKFFLIKDGNLLWEKSLKNNINSILITPNAKYIICGDRGGKVYLFDFNGDELKVFQSRGGEIYDVSVNEDGFGTVCDEQTLHYVYLFNTGETIKDIEIYSYQFGVRVGATSISKNGKYAAVSPDTEGTKGVYFFNSHDYIKAYVDKIKDKINLCLDDAKRMGVDTKEIERNINKAYNHIEKEEYKMGIDALIEAKTNCERSIETLKKDAKNRIEEVDEEILEKKKQGNDVEDAEKCINESKRLFKYTIYGEAKDKAEECHKIINPPPFSWFVVILIMFIILLGIIWYFTSRVKTDPIEEKMDAWTYKGFNVPFEIKDKIRKDHNEIHTYKNKITKSESLLKAIDEFLLKGAISKENRDKIEELKKEIQNIWYDDEKREEIFNKFVELKGK